MVKEKMQIGRIEYDDAKYHEEHGEVIVDKGLWEDAKKALSQEPTDDAVSRQAVKEALRNRTGESISECINAIPPINPQPCDDAISRDAVIDAIERVRNNHAYDEIEEIQKLPSVTPICEEREKGECPYYAG